MANFSLYEALAAARILPAITFQDADDALPVAEAALAAGQYVMELPFRSDAAAASIERIRKHFPEICVGAGTVLNPADLQTAIDAGAQFGLAPAFTPATCRAAIEKKFPFIPGVATPSEVEAAHALGLPIQKIFPAQQLGGPAYFRALDGPYARLDLHLIPMGGVTLANLAEYLALPNVIAVGGTWLASGALLKAKDYAQIERNFRDARAIAERAPKATAPPEK